MANEIQVVFPPALVGPLKDWLARRRLHLSLFLDDGELPTYCIGIDEAETEMFDALENLVYEEIPAPDRDFPPKRLFRWLKRRWHPNVWACLHGYCDACREDPTKSLQPLQPPLPRGTAGETMPE